MLGESHHYADFTMATGATRSPQPALVSTIKLRQAGFGACIDTEQMFRQLLARLAGERVVPMPASSKPRIANHKNREETPMAQKRWVNRSEGSNWAISAPMTRLER
jgi:hypothetical protein